MLSRHFLRSKVLQSLYAYVIAGTNDLSVIEKNFIHNIERLNDLSITQISTILQFSDFAQRSIEEGMKKFVPSEEDTNPNMRFVKNSFILQLKDNYELKKHCNQLKINWSNYSNIFRTLFNSYKTSPRYQKYMQQEIVDFESDKEITLDLFKHIVNYEPLVDVFIERNLFWGDDFYQIAQYTYNILKGLTSDFNPSSHFPMVYDEREVQEIEDHDFACTLLKKTILSFDENTNIIKNNLKQWEYERVAVMDIILLKMAITELIHFQSIPEKVSINEYVELSKEYSTSKSKLFINGILDKIHNELRSQGKIKKSGRGLFDENSIL